MKTAKYWAEQTRMALGEGLRYDGYMIGGKSVLETVIEQIQADAVESERLRQALLRKRERQNSGSLLQRPPKASQIAAIEAVRVLGVLKERTLHNGSGR